MRQENVQTQPCSKVYIVSGLYLFQEPSLQLLKSYFTSGPFSNSTRCSQSGETSIWKQTNLVWGNPFLISLWRADIWKYVIHNLWQNWPSWNVTELVSLWYPDDYPRYSLYSTKEKGEKHSIIRKKKKNIKYATIFFK